ncbi:MAG: hypothetical protein RR632_05550 [Christensenella sp.]
MHCFVKDRGTFHVVCEAVVMDYEIQESIYDVVSGITVIRPTVLPKTGDFLYLDGLEYCGVVKTVEQDEDKLKIVCNQMITMFGRWQYYADTTFTNLEAYLKNLIDVNYKNCVDELYKMPYLDVRANTQTPSDMRPDLEDGTYNVKSYTAKIRRLYGIFTEFDLSRSALRVDITRRSQQIKKIDMSYPDYRVNEDVVSDGRVGKITSYCEENGQHKDWYQMQDGTITNVYTTQNRVMGEWTPLTVQKAVDVDSSVRDVFASSAYSHKMSFTASANAPFELYDRVQIAHDSRLFASYITGIIRQKNSDRIVFQCGELQTKFPIQEVI